MALENAGINEHSEGWAQLINTNMRLQSYKGEGNKNEEWEYWECFTIVFQEKEVLLNSYEKVASRFCQFPEVLYSVQKQMFPIFYYYIN